mmetsp:Transcript_44679/g.82868  ORF Transcript_44679/g.82868 Transcript_44679/m.82868 type:complete len:405 (-) Transcript_44679:157-1371(-)
MREMAFCGRRLYPAVLLFVLQAETAITAGQHLLLPSAQQTVGFEGDLVPVQQQVLERYGEDVANELTNLGILLPLKEKNDSAFTPPVALSYYRWPGRDVNGMARVSYQVDPSFVGSKTMIEEALREIEDKTRVLKFVEKTQRPFILVTGQHVHHEHALAHYLVDIDYVFDCWSYVGYQNHAEQAVNLGIGCQTKGYFIHEFLHTLGLWHESARYDRDDYVTVLWGNIYSGLEYDFEKRIVDDTLGCPYDYESIMHDASEDFADFSEGESSAAFLAPLPIGQLEALSEGDIVKLRLLYQCKSGPRKLSDYQEHLCTADCKCWEGAVGCVNSNDACQGELVCSSNRCIHSSPPQTTASIATTNYSFSLEHVPWSIGCLVGAVLFCGLLYTLIANLFPRKRGYEIVP